MSYAVFGFVAPRQPRRQPPGEPEKSTPPKKAPLQYRLFEAVFGPIIAVVLVIRIFTAYKEDRMRDWRDYIGPVFTFVLCPFYPLLVLLFGKKLNDKHDYDSTDQAEIRSPWEYVGLGLWTILSLGFLGYEVYQIGTACFGRGDRELLWVLLGIHAVYAIVLHFVLERGRPTNRTTLLTEL